MVDHEHSIGKLVNAWLTINSALTLENGQIFSFFSFKKKNYPSFCDFFHGIMVIEWWVRELAIADNDAL